MANTPREIRQSLGCGFEPRPLVAIAVRPWQPPSSSLGYRHEAPSQCAGYLVRLPEVTEVARARHWSAKGELAVFCGGEQPNEQLVACIEVLDVAYSEVQRYRTTSEDDGGGRRKKGPS